MRRLCAPPYRYSARMLGTLLFLCLAGPAAHAHAGHHAAGGHQAHAASSEGSASAVFVPSTEKSFSALMDDAMVVMDQGMSRAPVNGQADHDFITMMMPHHQGAVDMAEAVLLYTKDPEIRNLALGIITEQQNEIRVMQAWLNHRAASAAQDSGD